MAIGGSLAIALPMSALDYHERTKHHFNRFARSAGYLDWATQPNPFRRFDGARLVDLPRAPVAVEVPYSALFDRSAPSLPITLQTLGEFLRCAMGLSAWKRYESTRWSLRVNPSSGNLHPTETYIVWDGRVFHYAVHEHALEERCVVRARSPSSFLLPPEPEPSGQFLLGLTSIHWREAWKYGERAFRYCQHDIGHALAALRLSAARLGWQLRLLTTWPDADIGTLLGLDRDGDFAGAEEEAPECLALVTPGVATTRDVSEDGDRAGLVEAARGGVWRGEANRLSRGHVEWPVIEQVASATRFAARDAAGAATLPPAVLQPASIVPSGASHAGASRSARAILLQRRSAVAFDPTSSLSAAMFRTMLSRLLPAAPPWDAVGWHPLVHLVLFVHRVDGMVPGMYAFTRAGGVRDAWRAAMRADFLWESLPGLADGADLALLLPVDMTWPAVRISCDQDIAGDGFFSLAMLARTSAIRTVGDWLYRRLFWEAGMIGQVLYLAAEAAGARATGIGCFYDDAVHELLGLPHAGDRAEWQSVYHFSMGVPVDDGRLTTEPGYEWESEANPEPEPRTPN